MPDLFGGVTLPGKPDLDNIARLDLLPIPMVRRMQRLGIAIDIEYFNELSSRFGREMKELQKDIASFIPVWALDQFVGKSKEVEDEDGDASINANSAEQISDLLFNVLRVGSGQKLKTTKGGNRISSGKKQLELLRNEHEIVPLILKYREYSKLKSTYTDSLPLIAKHHPRGSCPVCELSHDQETFRIHTEFPTTRAATGRFACVAHWTPVTTPFGPISISSLQLGDHVWTHRNRWRRVTGIYRKGWEDMFNIRFSNGYILTCTKSHRLLLSGYECIKALDKSGAQYPNDAIPLSIQGSADDQRYCGDDEDHSSQYSMGLPESSIPSGAQSPQFNPLFQVEGSRKESNVRKDGGSTSQLDWHTGRWTRVSDLLEGWQTSVRASDSNGRGAGVEYTTGSIRCASHRRERHQEQRSRQSSPSYESWAQENSLLTGEGRPICKIEEIAPAGCLEVYDISVEEDESYEACGVFSHNSRNPNLQNIPARTEEGRAVRAGFIASPGRRLTSVDFSQIELRDAAHCANAASMIEVYQQGKDIHIYTACRAFDVPYEKYAALAKKSSKSKHGGPPLTDKEKADFSHFSLNMRMPSKNLNFMIVYGAMAKGLQAQLALSGLFWSIEDCEKFIDRWFSLYPEMREYMDLQYYRARRYGLVWDLLGRIRLTPEVRSYHSWICSAGLRQAGNLPIQSVAAGQMKLAMGELEPLLLQLLDAGVWVWPLLTIHDELLLETEEEQSDDLREIVENTFSGVMRDRWRVPIGADGKSMERWVKD